MAVFRPIAHPRTGLVPRGTLREQMPSCRACRHPGRGCTEPPETPAFAGVTLGGWGDVGVEVLGNGRAPSTAPLHRHASVGWHLGWGSGRGRIRPPETPAFAGVTVEAGVAVEAGGTPTAARCGRAAWWLGASFATGAVPSPFGCGEAASWPWASKPWTPPASLPLRGARHGGCGICRGYP